MADRLDWERDGRDWPNREASRFVEAAGLRWHVQEAGAGPGLLLVHGTSASTHSWRDLLLPLARSFHVLAMDLPGHGFTTLPPGDGLSLAGMTRAVAELARTLAFEPAMVVGHSAGAAILVRACIDGLIHPKLLVSLNGALLPFHGIAGSLFAPVARLLATLSPVATLFARRLERDPAAFERLLRNTGSRLDPRGAELYRRLATSPGHVAAALGMMARWDLPRLEEDMPRLTVPLVLVTGLRDRTIRPAQAFRVRRLVKGARVVRLPNLGHLAHEEAPAEHVALLERLAREAGVLPA